MLTYWVVGGIVLLVAEIVLPGMVLGFLGAAALMVALLLWLGVIEGLVPALTTWFIGSIVMLVALRGFFQRLMPGDEEVQSTDEDFDAYGTVVEVAETIAKGEEGRIRFRGTTWAATCYEQALEAGSRARLVARHGITWVVEPLEEGPEDLV
jgi:membrane protein implicated in regulation of membrane protease activity